MFEELATIILGPVAAFAAIIAVASILNINSHRKQAKIAGNACDTPNQQYIVVTETYKIKTGDPIASEIVEKESKRPRRICTNPVGTKRQGKGLALSTKHMAKNKSTTKKPGKTKGRSPSIAKLRGNKAA